MHMSDSIVAETNLLAAPMLESPSGQGKWERERQAFVQLLPKLLATHRQQYVAIHEGQVVGAGSDLVDVARKAYAEFGYVPIYVDLVSDQPLPPVRITREQTQDAFWRLKPHIDESFPQGWFVALDGEQIIAHAPTREELTAIIRQMGREPGQTFMVQAGVEYLKQAIILDVDLPCT
jgi:hypothetical protein